MVSIVLFLSFLLTKYNKLTRKYNEDVKYLIVGAFTTIVSIFSYNVFRFFLKNYIICTALSWIVAVLFAYIANRRYVFFSKDQRILKEFSEFVFARILSLLAEIAVMYILVDFLNIADRVSKLIVQFIIVILNYIFSKLFVFKESDS